MPSYIFLTDGVTIFCLADVEYPSLKRVHDGLSSNLLVSDDSFLIDDDDDNDDDVDGVFDFLVDGKEVVGPIDDGDDVIEPDGPEADTYPLLI